MKPPYYRLTGRCRNEGCEQGLFTRESKTLTYKGTDDREHSKETLACPQCRCWTTIMKYEEVKA